ncbi:MAG TPA: 3-hydroxyacyl-CoA dehydrogenase/enoyl-CoA hydratase family protein [Chitinophagaceae bacterium]|nr:3-hydroxyacyl-CoA dehydrogenase/enoyl-CoA hydratase family protein [Chitinophagaceae bacterium]
MNRKIKKIAVLGSGVMGSRIACHFAGAGLQVILLDIVPGELNDAEKKKGLTVESLSFRNRTVNEALKAALASNPSPVYSQEAISRITTGNFTDNMRDIVGCDWVIEAVVENLDIKRKVFTEVEKFRKPGSLVSSNTSGIPIRLMAEGRSPDFRANFCGTHFFNPPRYLKLLEIIPGPDTDPGIVDFLLHYGDLFLGKTTVLCKDTPAFIANRVGVFSIMAVFHIMEILGLNVNEVDALTGPVIGRPKSATFRTNDVVGIDTLARVAAGVAENCPQDEAAPLYKIPGFLREMLQRNWLGDKSGQGFYRKTGKGKDREILTLDLKTLEYGPGVKAKFPSLDAVKGNEDLRQRIKTLAAAPDLGGEFIRQFHYYLFSYISFRIPEIADDLYRIDDALKAGFGWEIGAFETWDLLGVSQTLELMKAGGFQVAPWVDQMLIAGHKTFYQVDKGVKSYYDIRSLAYQEIPGAGAFLILEQLNAPVWENKVCRLMDTGEGIVCVEWKTRMNTIGGDVLEGINKSLDLAEKDFRGLVVANEGIHFSAGANVGILFMLASGQEFDELNLAVRVFQNTSLRIRYSSIPVVVAPHGLTLGGGCELCLHADKVQAAAETYIGLVELGVGLIPGGGGTKEFTLRASDAYFEGDIQLPTLQHRFQTIAMAKVSGSAEEAYPLGILRHGTDEITLNPRRLITEARKAAINLAEKGYIAPLPRLDIRVLGRTALGALLAGINGMLRGNYISAHDAKIAGKLAYVMCGGDLTEASLVSEQYLLDLEREAFLSLCGERKTLERLQSVIKQGKPIRN